MLTPATPSDDGDLHIDNYTFYRKDRDNGNGRGAVKGFSSQTTCFVYLAWTLVQELLNFYGLKFEPTRNVSLLESATDPQDKIEMNKTHFLGY